MHDIICLIMLIRYCSTNQYAISDFLMTTSDITYPIALAVFSFFVPMSLGEHEISRREQQSKSETEGGEEEQRRPAGRKRHCEI